jgi:DNA-binding NarL/FixJ family response regulator
MVIQVLLTCKHKMVSEGIASFLKLESDIALLGVIDSLQDAREKCQVLKPDVLVMGARADSTEDIELIYVVARENPAVRVVVVSSQPHREVMLHMLDAGVTGFVSTISSMAELMTAIRFAATGRSYVCQVAAQILLDALRKGFANSPTEGHLLGVREEQVLGLIADGLSTKEIARQLAISPSTVDVHRRNIMRKVGLHKVADLTRYAIRNMLVPA